MYKAVSSPQQHLGDSKSSESRHYPIGVEGKEGTNPEETALFKFFNSFSNSFVFEAFGARPVNSKGKNAIDFWGELLKGILGKHENNNHS